MGGDGIRDVWKRGCCSKKGSELDTLIIEYCLLTIWFPLKHKCPEVDVYHWHEAEQEYEVQVAHDLCIPSMLLGMMANVGCRKKWEPSTMLSRKVREVHESYTWSSIVNIVNWQMFIKLVGKKQCFWKALRFLRLRTSEKVCVSDS